MKITMRHYFDFGPDRAMVGDDLALPGRWDALRTRTMGAFRLPSTPAELERTANEDRDLAQRAGEIDRLLEGKRVKTLASYGVGAGLLEFWLQQLRPDRRLLLTDNAPETVEGLRRLFPEADVRAHDLSSDLPLEADAHLLHRVDTELSDREWRDFLRRFAGESLVVVATEVATLPRLAAELVGRVRRRGLTRAGWLRTRDAFEALWLPTHEAVPLRLHDLDGWVLEPREPRNMTAP
jgi:hypothetical protein